MAAQGEAEVRGQGGSLQSSIGHERRPCITACGLGSHATVLVWSPRLFCLSASWLLPQFVHYPRTSPCGPWTQDRLSRKKAEHLAPSALCGRDPKSLLVPIMAPCFHSSGRITGCHLPGQSLVTLQGLSQTPLTVTNSRWPLFSPRPSFPSSCDLGRSPPGARLTNVTLQV